MDTLSLFATDISDFKLNIPLWVKIGIIIVLILALLMGGYFVKTTIDVSPLKGGYMWYIVIALINLISILLIYYYYGTNTNTYVGAKGIKGNKGKRGKVGKSSSCSYNCKDNIYIQTVKKTEIVCTLSVYNNAFTYLINNYNYFNDFIIKGIAIDYNSFIKNVLINDNNYAYTSIQQILTPTQTPTSTPTQTPTSTPIPIPKLSTESINLIDKFRVLISINSITIFLIKHINIAISLSSTRTYGTFRMPVAKVGYISVGNSVYGGIETTSTSKISNDSSFNLTSFVISGDIMYPGGFTKLVSFKSYNENTMDYDMYTLWKPQIQSVNDAKALKALQTSKPAQKSYLSLGDICSFSNRQPKLNDYALINEDCLDPVSIMDLGLVFIYIGDFEFTTDAVDMATQKAKEKTKTQNIDYTQSDSYLIENKVVSDIEIFSIWRTPMNTFITNCNTDNNLINNTLMYNMLNGIEEALNDYGNINNKYKKWVSDSLNMIPMPNFLTAMIYTKNLTIESRKDLIYYINKYQAQIPDFVGKEFIISLSTKTLSELLTIVKNVIDKYDTFNKELIKSASISLRGTKPLLYDETKERIMPPMLSKTYNNIIDKINTLPIQIENAKTFLDVVKHIIPNGLNGRIAIDSDGIVEGGFFLNEIQELIVRICKIIFPPTRLSYTIKDECLGTFARDTTRDSIIRDFINEKTIYNKYIDIIKNDGNKYESQIQMLTIYEDISIKKFGQLCGHIANYMDKIHNADLDEITTSRIQGLINIYKDINKYLSSIVIDLDL